MIPASKKKGCGGTKKKKFRAAERVKHSNSRASEYLTAMNNKKK